MESRETGTRNLVAGIAASDPKPAVLVSSSAVGYYGKHGDEKLPESTPAGTDFLAGVCVAWEREADAAEQLGLRVVKIRTGVVLLMAWLVVLVTGKQRAIRGIDGRSWLFLVLSGVTTGLSWLCYYRALQEGPASVVVPLDKLSILVSIGFGALVFGERLSLRAGIGLALIVAGTLALVL